MEEDDSISKNFKGKEENQEDEKMTANEEAMLRELNRHEERVGEIERRQQESIKMKKEKASYGLPAKAPTVKLQSKFDYKFAVVNKSHRMLNPPCKCPAFRILGLFKHERDFNNWVDDLKEFKMLFFDEESESMKCKLGDLHKLPLEQYMLIPKNSIRERDAEYTKEKIEQIKKKHLDHLEMSIEEFKQHHTERTQGKMGLSLEKQREKAREKNSKSSRSQAVAAAALENEKGIRQENSRVSARNSMKEVARVPRMMELRGQQYAIVIVLIDVSISFLAGKDDPEPAIMLIDCFDTIENAEAHMETLKNYIFCMNMFIVDMYEWLFPEDIVLDDIKEKYRNPEQNKLMNDKKLRKEELLKYEQELKSEGKEVKAIEVTEDSKAPENFDPLKPVEFKHEESSEPVDREALQREDDQRVKEYSKLKKGPIPEMVSGQFNFDLDK